MSRTLTLTGIYGNNKTNTIGLHCPINNNQPDTRINFEDLLFKIDKYFKGKNFKKYKIHSWSDGNKVKNIDELAEMRNLDLELLSSKVQILKTIF